MALPSGFGIYEEFRNNKTGSPPSEATVTADGFTQISIAYQGPLWDGDAEGTRTWGTIQQSVVEAIAAAAEAAGRPFLSIDAEKGDDTGDTSSGDMYDALGYSSPGTITQLEGYNVLVDWIKNEFSGLVSHYAPPLAFIDIRDWDNGDQSQEWADWQTANENWRDTVVAGDTIGNRIDVISEHPYMDGGPGTFRPYRAVFEQYVRDLQTEAARVFPGKPWVPYLWWKYANGNFMPTYLWKMQIAVVYRMYQQGRDVGGFIVWDGSAEAWGSEHQARYDILLDFIADPEGFTAEFYAVLKLHQDFENASTLAEAALVGPTLTLARNSIGTYFDVNGVLQTATANNPRFNHPPGGGAPGILIEEARTNVSLSSQDFTNATHWTNLFTTDAANQAVAPDGNTTADELIETTDYNQHGLYTANGVLTTVDATAYSGSVFAKKGDGASAPDIIQLSFRSAGHPPGYANVNLSTGAVTASSGVDDSGILDVGGGWFWCWIVDTSDAAAANSGFVIGFVNNNPTGTQLPSYGGSTDANVFIWQADTQVGAFPTSPIPTTTSAVTREADLLTTTTLTWFNQDTGAFYARASIPLAGTVERAIACIDDGSADDRIRLYMDAAENINFETINSADNNGASDGSATIAVDTEFQAAGGYADDDVNCAVDGTLSGQDTTAGIPVTDSATTFRVGSDSAGNYVNGTISEIKAFDPRVSDGGLTVITNGLVVGSSLGRSQKTDRVRLVA